jgi:TAT (twin-arginine translocation) pathway-exported protein
MGTNSSKHKSQDGKITRRDFLKLAGVAGAVGATLPSSLLPFGQALGGGTTNNTNNNQPMGNMSAPMNRPSTSVHIFDLDGAKPQFYNSNGSRTSMNANNFSILTGMGAALLRLRKGGVREPH